MVVAHTAPPSGAACTAIISTAWAAPPASSAICFFALASNAHGVKPGPFRVAGLNVWEAAWLPSRSALPLASRVAVAVDLRRDHLRCARCDTLIRFRGRYLLLEWQYFYSYLLSIVQATSSR